MLHKLGWALSGALTLLAVLALARATVAGPLDPPGPVGSTMRTLDELLPSWGRHLDATGGCNSARFTCVFNDSAVLDHETGLVWRIDPNPTATNWEDARADCENAQTGDSTGWRLPRIDELGSLASNLGVDGLPNGHPFTFASGTNYYWSSTSDENDPAAVRLAQIQQGGPIYTAADKTDDSLYFHWCVRGPSGATGASRPDEQPSWSRALPSNNSTNPCNSARFRCVMDDQAVLDRETGLVWDRDPSTQLRDWTSALENCFRRTLTGRAGWRLPTAAELGTLIDPSVIPPTVMLPVGHPFTVAGARFWSSTEGGTSTANAYVVDFALPDTAEVAKTSTVTARAWCVRGASGAGR